MHCTKCSTLIEKTNENEEHWFIMLRKTGEHDIIELCKCINVLENREMRNKKILMYESEEFKKMRIY